MRVLLSTIGSGGDVIVGATALQIAAPSVAERMGIPYVFVAYCPAVLPSSHPCRPRRKNWHRQRARFEWTDAATLTGALANALAPEVAERARAIEVRTDGAEIAAHRVSSIRDLE